LTLGVIYDSKTAISTKRPQVKSKANAMLSKHNFESKMIQVLSEKNIFKLDAAFAILKSAARFSVLFDFMRFLLHENGNLEKNV
jgi:hypothetical protein